MAYTMDLWGEQISAFLGEVICRPAVLVGNSVGSLACLIAAAAAAEEAASAPAPASASVVGVALCNCAGGMNNKAVR